MQSAEPLARTRTIESPQPAKAVASAWGGIPVAKKMRRCKIGADYARIENVHPCPSDSRGDALLINHVRVLNDVSIHAPPNSRGDAHRPRFTTWNRGVSIHAPEFEGRCVLVAGFDVAESRSFNPRPPNSRGDASQGRRMGMVDNVSIHAPRIRGAMPSSPII